VKWVHMSVARKGLSGAMRCDICRSRYRMPSNAGIRENLGHRFRHACRDVWLRILHSPVGPVVRVFATTGYFYSALSACYGAAAQLSEMPKLLFAARRDLSALRPLLPRFGAAVIVEPMLTTSELSFHAETALFYAAGWLLDCAARMTEVGTPLETLMIFGHFTGATDRLGRGI